MATTYSITRTFKMDEVTPIFKIAVVIPLVPVAMMLFYVVAALLYRELGGEARSESEPSPHWTVNWSVVGEVGRWILGLVVCLAIAWYVWRRIVRRKQVLRAVIEAEQVRRQQLAARNHRDVRGLDYAKSHGLVTDDEIQTLDANVLQDMIDAANPMADLLISSLDLLVEYERDKLVLGRRERKRRDELKALIHELRTIPEVVRLRAIGAETDEFLVDAQGRLDRAKQLPEG
ncbi:MAG TPA: hypothetical protein VF597_03340 [Candidatus Saccharimonadales bacterium]